MNINSLPQEIIDEILKDLPISITYRVCDRWRKRRLDKESVCNSVVDLEIIYSKGKLPLDVFIKNIKPETYDKVSDYFPFLNHISVAIEYGNFELFKHIYNEKVLSVEKMTVTALRYGQKNVLEFLMDKGHSLAPYIYLAVNTRSSLFKFMCKTYPAADYPEAYEKALLVALNMNNTGAIKYLLTLPIQITEDIFQAFIDGMYLEFLEIFTAKCKEQGFTSTTSIAVIMYKKNLQLFEATKDIVTDTENALNLAIEIGSLSTVKFLIEKCKITSSIEHVKHALELRYYRIYKYLEACPMRYTLQDVLDVVNMFCEMM